MYYHDAQYWRQRHQERMAEMREEYRRAQRPPRHDDRPRERERHMHLRAMWQWMRQHAMHHGHAHRA